MTNEPPKKLGVDSTLRNLINSACPRTHKGLQDYENGSLEVVFTENLRRLNLQEFSRTYGGQEIRYYSEFEEPTLFSNTGLLIVADRANYTVIKYRDGNGQVWTIEVFHPKFQEQELGISTTSGQRTDRVMYAFSEEKQSLYLSKVNVSLRGDPANRYQHDTVSIRLDENEIPQQIRLRLQHNTALKREPAKENREKSPNYGHVHQFDESHVLSTYVTIRTKIVFGYDETFSEEQQRFEDYISTFEIVDYFYTMPLGQSFVREIRPATLNHTNISVNTVAVENGHISLGNVEGNVLEIDVGQIQRIGFVPSLIEQGSLSHVEQLFVFGKTQIDTCLKQFAKAIVITRLP